jgi:peroxiredoxin Q/BCP
MLLDEGTEAPPFDLPDHTGGRVALRDLAGKWVVLWWFPKASTPG